MKLLLRVLIVLVLLGAATAALLYVRRAQQDDPLTLSGTIEARSVAVGSLVGGRVARVLVDEGSVVAAGDLLVTLETDPVDRQIEEQKAIIAAAEAELAKAVAGPRNAELQRAEIVAANSERERRRNAALLEEGVVSRSVYDAAATKARTDAEDLRLLRQGTRSEDIAAARATVERQKRHLETLLEQRSETNVVSSVSGIVQSFGLRVGDLVAPNQTVAEILERDQLWVRVYVPETLLGRVRVGEVVPLRIDTFPDRSFRGTVATISERGEYTPRNVQTPAQRAEQMFAVKVVVSPDPALKAGMAAEVALEPEGPQR